ncbi:MAG: hypothetical protein AB8G96_13785 [Phycisphaerales bacterium]
MPAPKMIAFALTATVAATAGFNVQEAAATDLRITTTGSIDSITPGFTELADELNGATSFEVVYRVAIDEQAIGNRVTWAEWRNQEILAGSSIISLVLRDAAGDVVFDQDFSGGGLAAGAFGQSIDESASLAILNDQMVTGGSLDRVAMLGQSLRDDASGFIGLGLGAERESAGPDDTMFAAIDGVALADLGGTGYDLGGTEFDDDFFSLRSESFEAQGMTVDWAVQGSVDRIQFAVVPVPAPVLLGGLGLLAAGAARRRFNRG